MTLFRLHCPQPYPFEMHGYDSTNTLTSVDDVGEKWACVGPVIWDDFDGNSEPKTIQSIFYNTGIVTADATMTVRVGIQDIDLLNSGTYPGIPDGVFDVYQDVVPVSGDSVNFVELTSLTGTKTVAFGDIIALVAECTARSGSGRYDLSTKRLIGTNGWTGGLGMYSASYLASVWTVVTGHACVVLKFTDGTYGTLGRVAGGIYTRPEPLNLSIDVDTTPDEVGLEFVQQFDCTIGGLFYRGGDHGSVDADWDMCLYDDRGTLLRSVSVDRSTFASPLANTNVWPCWFTEEIKLEKGKKYIISVKPTTTTNLTEIEYGTVNAGQEDMLDFAGFGYDAWWVERTDGVSWLDVSRTHTQRLFVGYYMTEIDDGIDSRIPLERRRYTNTDTVKALRTHGAWR